MVVMEYLGAFSPFAFGLLKGARKNKKEEVLPFHFLPNFSAASRISLKAFRPAVRERGCVGRRSSRADGENQGRGGGGN